MKILMCRDVKWLVSETKEDKFTQNYLSRRNSMAIER